MYIAPYLHPSKISFILVSINIPPPMLKVIRSYMYITKHFVGDGLSIGDDYEFELIYIT